MRALTLVLFTSVVGLAVGCGGSQASPSGQTGTLNVRITDSPYSEALALFVTFSQASAHRADTDTDIGEWIDLPLAGGSPTRTCDLKRLVDAEDILGVGPLPAGHYTQIRLDVASATLYFDAPSTGPVCAPALDAPGGASAPVTVSSGQVKLNRPFDLSESAEKTILVDFDGDKSVVHAGATYRMSPVIAIVSVQ